jgi:cytochrome c oxidase cbb3-type subunit III
VKRIGACPMRWRRLVRPCIVASAAAILWMARKPCTAQENRNPPKERPARGNSAARGGKHAFESACGVCHGLDGRGGPHAPGIAGNPEVQSLCDRALAEVIANGKPAKGMPSFGFLGDREIQTIVGYIRVLGNGLPKAAKGDPLQGEKLFFGKAGCSTCHTVAGKGGFIASDLSSFSETHGADEIRKAILTPSQVLGLRGQLISVETGDGSRFSGVIRNEDNFSLQLLSVDGAFHLLMKKEIRKLTREPGSLMPSDYGERMTAKEIEDVTSYLAAVASSIHSLRAPASQRKDAKGADHAHGTKDSKRWSD